MRIAMVSEHASPLAALGDVDAGGQNVHVADLACGLARHGHEVLVYTRRDDPSLPTDVPVAPSVAVRHLNAGPAQPVPKDALPEFMPAFTRLLARDLAAVRPDVVHSHFWMSGAAAVAAAPPGTPTAHTYHALGAVKRRHQGTADSSPPDRCDVERRLAGDVDRLVVTCRDEVAELQAMGAATDHARLVPCGVDVDRFRPTGPREPRPPGRQRIVVIGRLVPRKGIDDVLQAVAGLDDVELVVVGGPGREALSDDPHARRLEDVADRLGVGDRLQLLGSISRSRVPPLVRSADVVACAPWYEPFGIVPLEAMACGVPVVATSVGGMLDSVVDGRTGVLVPPRRPDRLRTALSRLLADERLRARMGAAGVARAQRVYAWDVVAGQTADVYHETARAPIHRAVS